MVHRISKTRGQFLIEAMVAMSIITIGLLGILALLSNATSLNRVVADEYSATYLAAEGIEVVKSIIDVNAIKNQVCGFTCVAWNEGLSNGDFEAEYDDINLSAFSGRPLKYDDGVYGYNSGTDTIFLRKITVELVGSDQVNVSSKVNWVSRGGITFDTTLADVFYNWR